MKVLLGFLWIRYFYKKGCLSTYVCALQCVPSGMVPTLYLRSTYYLPTQYLLSTLPLLFASRL